MRLQLKYFFVLYNCLVINYERFFCTASIYSNTDFYLIDDPSAQNGSYFGFSLLLQVSYSGFDSSVIIGAPKANSTYSSHDTIFEPGVVYKCLLKSRNGLKAQCSQIILDPAGNGNEDQQAFNNFKHDKSGAFIGFAIDGSKYTEEPFIVCGPKWKNHIYATYLFPNGICYYLNDTLTTNKIAKVYVPLIEKSKQVFLNATYYAFGEAGFTVRMSETKNKVYFGAIGIYKFRGTVIEQDVQNFQSNFNMRLANPKYISNLKDSSYLGYALETINIVINGTRSEWLVAGAPRGADLDGQVFVMQYIGSHLHVLTVKSSLQLGSYFGAALCIADVNGDGVSDIVVGAPMFKTASYEEGAVFVLVGNPDSGTFEMKREIVVENGEAGARFGTSMARAGDLNNDGCDDVVVGAPYEENGRGAVYLFLGEKGAHDANSRGLQAKFFRKIRAAELSPVLRAFGSAFSRSLDIDQNSCKDIAIGAYKSGHVVVLLAQPTVEIFANLIVQSNLTAIAPNQTEIELRLCFNYTGANVPSRIVLDNTLVATSGLFFHNSRQIGGGQFTKSLQFEQIDCDTILLTFNDSIRQYYNLDITLNYTIIATDVEKFRNPVLGPWLNSTVHLTIPIEAGINLQVIRQSIPNQLVYIVDDPKSKSELVKRIEHNYNVVNSGPRVLKQLQLYFYIPFRIVSHEANYRNLIDFNSSEVTFNDDVIACQFLSHDTINESIALEPFADRDLETLNLIRTQFFNCSASNNSTKCMLIYCLAENLTVNSNPINVRIKLDLIWIDFDMLTDDKQDAVYYTSIMQIICSPLCTNNINFYSTHTTIFLLDAIRVSVSIVFGSILLGLVSLSLIAFGLYKANFYRRTDRDRIQLLKESNENDPMLFE